MIKKPGFFYGYVVVAATFVILAVSLGIHHTFGVFFKPLSTEFGWTRATTSGAFTLRSLLSGFLVIGVGRLSDRFGPRLVTLVTGLFLGLSLLLMWQISTAWHFYLVYGVIGAIGSSGLYVPCVSTVAGWFTKNRALMTGIALCGSGLGTLVLPPLANYLISNYGWRISYVIIGIPALILLSLAALFLKRNPGQTGQLSYGKSETGQESLDSQITGFSLREAIHTRQFWLLVIIFLCFGIGLQAILVHIVPHATDLGISPVNAANIIAIIGGASVIGRIIVGSFADRKGSRPTLAICFIVMLISFLWLLIAKEMWMFLLFAVIFGAAYGGIFTLESPMIAEFFGMRFHGSIFACINSSMPVSSIIGPILSGWIFDVTGSYNYAFLICSIMSIVGLISGLLLRPVERR